LPTPFEQPIEPRNAQLIRNDDLTNSIITLYCKVHDATKISGPSYKCDSGRWAFRADGTTKSHARLYGLYNGYGFMGKAARVLWVNWMAHLVADPMVNCRLLYMVLSSFLEKARNASTILV
jgi:hypothetical protein